MLLWATDSCVVHGLPLALRLPQRIWRFTFQPHTPCNSSLLFRRYAWLLGLALGSAPAAWAQASPAVDKAKSKTTMANGSTSKKKSSPARCRSAAHISGYFGTAGSAERLLSGCAGEHRCDGHDKGEWLADLGAAQAPGQSHQPAHCWPFSRAPTGASPASCSSRRCSKARVRGIRQGPAGAGPLRLSAPKEKPAPAAQLKLNERPPPSSTAKAIFRWPCCLSPEGKVLAKTGYLPGGPAAFEAYLKQLCHRCRPS